MTHYLSITRRKVMGVMVGLVGSLALNGCQPAIDTNGSADSSASADSDAMTVSVVPWIGYSPLYVADAKGFFEEAGVTVDPKTFSSGADGLASFAAGNTDALAATNPEAVAQAARNVDYKIVLMADSSLGGDGILARNNVQDIADFKGRKVGVDIGGTSYYFLLQALREKADLSIDDVEAVNVAADAAAAAYQAGTIDIAVTYEPFLSSGNQAQPDGRVILDTAEMPTAILDIYVFQADYVDQNPEKVQAFVDAIFKGIDFIENSPEEAHAIIAEELEIVPEEVAEQLEGVDLTSLENNKKVLTGEGAEQSMVENLVALSQFLVDQDEIDEPLTAEQVEGMIDTRFIEAASIDSAETAESTEAAEPAEAE